MPPPSSNILAGSGSSWGEDIFQQFLGQQLCSVVDDDGLARSNGGGKINGAWMSGVHCAW